MTTYTNPVIRGFNPDPSFCRVGEDYYLVTSTFGVYPGVPVYHSRDLVHWKLIGHCLTRPSQLMHETVGIPHCIFAANIRYHAGTFYMITTSVTGGGNFYVTATNPAGPWSDPILVDKEVFDPDLFFDDDGKVYYLRRGAMEDKDIIQAEIDIKTGKLLTPMRRIALGMVSDDCEGPHLYKINGWYYLMQAEGGARFLHMECIGRSKSPWGPFESCPHNPILAQHHAWWHKIRAIGHSDILQAHDGSWWMVFLGTRHLGYNSFSAIGRETFLVPFEWKDGWPVVPVEPMRHVEVKAKTLPLQPWPEEPARDDFDSEKLDLKWTFIGYPQPGVYSLQERKGFLRLHGQAGILENGRSVAYIGRRQEHLNFEASTALEFDPANPGEEAGLSLFQARDYHYDLALTIRDGKRCLLLRKTVGDIIHEDAPVPVPTGRIELRITADPDRYHFSWRAPDGQWQAIGSAMSQLVATEVCGSWAGMLLGLYARGEKAPCRNPADFDYFDYQGTGE